MPKYEIVKRGFSQLILICFKHVYGLLKKDLKLPELTPEPEIIAYDDDTYALNWWPHYLYRVDIDEPVNHEHFAMDGGEGFHNSYIEDHLYQKKMVEQRLKEVFLIAEGEYAPLADFEELEEKCKQLTEENLTLKEEKAKKVTKI